MLPKVADAKEAFEDLANGLPTRDERSFFADLVCSSELAAFPVHRWYAYKEAYSPRLPVGIVDRLGTGTSGVVVDPFAGVATTALALQHHDKVARVVGVEYSPFVHFAGKAKLLWSDVDPQRMRKHIRRLRHYRNDPALPIPGLAAFSNPEVFKPAAVRSLLSARAAIESDGRLRGEERKILLLGLAAIIEDVSCAMKDGRALRILRGRQRRPKALRPLSGATTDGGVRGTLVNQWLAMTEDLDALWPVRAAARKRRDCHLRGDARDLSAVLHQGHHEHPLASGSAGLCMYSPPYLNCIDYTEVYKLELWLLGFVTNQDEFRDVRLGTLRSHPSIRFPGRSYLSRSAAPVSDVIDLIAGFLDEQLPRPGLGTMTRDYFDDMYAVLSEQHRLLEPGGHAVCIVGNSMFSRRSSEMESRKESWRLPLLTDVILARLAEAVGFQHVEIWEARDLMPRNVRQGSSRESLVLARKAG
jgi:hypothetical protein